MDDKDWWPFLQALEAVGYSFERLVRFSSFEHVMKEYENLKGRLEAAESALQNLLAVADSRDEKGLRTLRAFLQTLRKWGEAAAVGKVSTVRLLPQVYDPRRARKKMREAKKLGDLGLVQIEKGARLLGESRGSEVLGAFGAGVERAGG